MKNYFHRHPLNLAIFKMTGICKGTDATLWSKANVVRSKTLTLECADNTLSYLVEQLKFNFDPWRRYNTILWSKAEVFEFDTLIQSWAYIYYIPIQGSLHWYKTDPRQTAQIQHWSKVDCTDTTLWSKADCTWLHSDPKQNALILHWSKTEVLEFNILIWGWVRRYYAILG